MNQAAQHREFVKEDLSELAIRNSHQMSNNIEKAKSDIKDDLAQSQRQANVRQAVLLQRADSHSDAINDVGNRLGLIQQDVHVNVRRIVGLCFGARPGTRQMFRSAQRGTQRLQNMVQSLYNEQRQSNSKISSGIRFLLNHLEIVRTIGDALLRTLMSFSEMVLQHLRENMRITMEIYEMLINLSRNMPRLFTESEVIQFEDALGRVENLPFRWFRHFDVFEKMLHHHFKGVPGEEKVQQGHYVLMRSDEPDLIYDKAYWERDLLPGAKVKMSMRVQILLADRGSCPRPRCNGRTRYLNNSAVAQCPTCELAFVPRSLRHSQALAKAFEGTEEWSVASREQREEFARSDAEDAQRELQELTVFKMIHI